MSKNLRESLSALMDGEASELEVRRLLRENDDSLTALWGRFHRQRGALRDETGFADLDVSASVRRALAAERPHRRLLGDWRKPLAGIAVAASVASVVVFGLGGPPGEQATTLADIAVEQGGRVYLAAPTAPASGAVAANTAAGAVPAELQMSDQQSRQRFEKLLRQHTEHAAFNSGQGMVSHARLASYRTE